MAVELEKDLKCQRIFLWYKTNMLFLILYLCFPLNRLLHSTMMWVEEGEVEDEASKADTRGKAVEATRSTASSPWLIMGVS